MIAPSRRFGTRGPVLSGLAAIVLLLGGVAAWGLGARISGAVIARGVLASESDRQVVQHSEGGVVAEILVRDGDRVRAGDVLLRIDATFLAADLALIDSQRADLAHRRTRLEAVRDGVEPDLDRTAPVEAALFRAEQAVLRAERSLLSDEIGGTEFQIKGIEAELHALHVERDLVDQQLRDQETLARGNLLPRDRLRDTARQRAVLSGRIGSLEASRGEARQRIAGLRMEGLRLGERRRAEALGELGEIERADIDLAQRRIALMERLSLLDIRAPTGGIVFASRVHAPKTVVLPAEALLSIVPDDRPPIATLSVAPADAARLYPGQAATLVLPGLDRAHAPRIVARVERIAPDTAKDPATGAPRYEVTLRPDAAALSALPAAALRIGTPVEAFLETGARAPLDYLLDPLLGHAARAFRED